MTVTRRALLAGSAAVVVSVAVPAVSMPEAKPRWIYHVTNRDVVYFWYPDRVECLTYKEFIEWKLDKLYHDSHQPVIGNHERNHLD